MRKSRSLTDRLESAASSACDPGCMGRCRECPADAVREAIAEIARLTAAEDHQRAMAGEMLRAAERAGRRADQLEHALRRLDELLEEDARAQAIIQSALGRGE